MCTKWKYVILVSYTLPTYFSWYHNMLPAQGQPCTQLHYFGFLLHHNKANCNLHMNIKVSKIQNRQVIQKEAHMEWTDNIINILLTYWNYHPFVKICGIYNTILKYKIKIIPYIYIYGSFFTSNWHKNDNGMYECCLYTTKVFALQSICIVNSLCKY